jgi:hypothetical protein
MSANKRTANITVFVSFHDKLLVNLDTFSTTLFLDRGTSEEAIASAIQGVVDKTHEYYSDDMEGSMRIRLFNNRPPEETAEYKNEVLSILTSFMESVKDEVGESELIVIEYAYSNKKGIVVERSESAVGGSLDAVEKSIRTRLSEEAVLTKGIEFVANTDTATFRINTLTERK